MTVPRTLPTATHNPEQPVVRRKDQPTDVTPDIVMERNLSCFHKASGGQNRDDVESEYSGSRDETTYSEIFGVLGWSGYDTVAMSTIVSDASSTTTSEYGYDFSTATDSESDGEREAERRSRRNFLQRFRRGSMEEETVNDKEVNFSVVREVAKCVSLYSLDVDDDHLDHDEARDHASNDCNRRDVSNFASDSFLTHYGRNMDGPSSDGKVDHAKIEESPSLKTAIRHSERSWFSKEARNVTKETSLHDRDCSGVTHSDKKVNVPLSWRATSPSRDSGILDRGTQRAKCRGNADKRTVPLELPRHPADSAYNGIKHFKTTTDASKNEEASPRNSGIFHRGTYEGKGRGIETKSTVPLELPRPPAVTTDDGAKQTKKIADASKKEGATKSFHVPERQWNWIHEKDKIEGTGGTRTLQPSKTTKDVVSRSVAAKKILKSKDEIDVRSGLPFGMDATTEEGELADEVPRVAHLKMEKMSSVYHKKPSATPVTRNLKQFLIPGGPRAKSRQSGDGERRSLRNMIWKARAKLGKTDGFDNDSNTLAKTMDSCSVLLCFCTD